LGTNDWAFLYPQDLTNSPAISSLYSICKNYSGRDYSGTSVDIFPENGRHIEVKFGNHWSLKRFYIFNPNAAVTFNPPSNWFQVTSNIFASK
jgi:DNA topoisomerase VI subunit B